MGQFSFPARPAKASSSMRLPRKRQRHARGWRSAHAGGNRADPWMDRRSTKSPDQPIPSGPESHWSFKQPVRPAVPQVKNATWVRNPVDAFVAAEHEPAGCRRERRQKSRCFSGGSRSISPDSPPTRNALNAFLADTSSDAYEKVWTVARQPALRRKLGAALDGRLGYSDWAGYDTEVRFSRPHIWRWRDWIIESLNADKPYDQMVREMLAGDEIAPADPRLSARRILARNWSLYNRVGWMDEAVEHTSKAFLGLTFNCAKCHDHMFDPVSQREYFQYRSIFETYDVRVDPVPGIIDTNASGIVRVVDGDEKRPTYLFIRGDDRNPNKDELMTPTVPASLGGKYEVAKIDLPPAGYYNGLKDYVRKDLLAAADTAVAAAEKTLAEKEKYQAASRLPTPPSPPRPNRPPRSRRRPRCSSPILSPRPARKSGKPVLARGSSKTESSSNPRPAQHSSACIPRPASAGFFRPTDFQDHRRRAIPLRRLQL